MLTTLLVLETESPGPACQEQTAVVKDLRAGDEGSWGHWPHSY